MSNAPYSATITLDVWAFDRTRAAELLEQLVSTLEQQQTNDRGGLGIHHQIVATELARKF